jgi:DNA polymerase-3 subunit gamma/tau
MLYEAAPDFSDIYIVDSRENLAATARLFNRARLLAASKRLHEAARDLSYSIQPRLTAEICLLELCQLDAALEQAGILARLERLEALAKAGGIPHTPPKAPAATPLPTSTVVVPPPKPVLEAQPSQAQEQAAAVNAAAQPPIEPIKEPKPALPENTGDIWAKTLAELITQKKRMLHAYAEKGRLADLSQGVARIEFEDDSRCRQLQTGDYRKIIEGILTGLAGQPIRAEFISRGLPAATAAKKDTPARQPDNSPADDIPEAARQALEVFGGELVKIKK